MHRLAALLLAFVLSIIATAASADREPHVVDRPSFEALCQHIGHRSFGMSSWYDTRGAVAAGDRVFEEIRRQHMSR